MSLDDNQSISTEGFDEAATAMDIRMQKQSAQNQQWCFQQQQQQQQGQQWQMRQAVVMQQGMQQQQHPLLQQHTMQNGYGPVFQVASTLQPPGMPYPQQAMQQGQLMNAGMIQGMQAPGNPMVIGEVPIQILQQGTMPAASSMSPVSLC